MRISANALFGWLMMMCCAGTLKAQVVMSVQIPSAGLLQKEQLWNVLVVNNAGDYSNVVLNITLRNERTQQRVFTGSSKPFSLPKGAHQLALQHFSPIQYSYYGSAASADPSGLLPIGRWVISYHLDAGLPGKEVKLAEEHLPVEIAPLSPPQLVFPSDRDTVDTRYPHFSWLPPAAMGSFNSLSYSFLLVEVKDKQNANDAIQRNALVYREDHLTTPQLHYAASLNALQPGSTYAWQVVATNDSHYADKTEVWTFCVRKESAAAIILDDASYPRLKQGYNSDYYICEGKKIRFSYENSLSEKSLPIKIYDITGEGRTEVFNKTQQLERGTNFIDLPVNGSTRFSDEHIYLLEVIDTRNQSWNLAFKYIPRNK